MKYQRLKERSQGNCTSFKVILMICQSHYPTRKMTMLDVTFEVNSCIGKFWDLLGQFDEKDTVDFKIYHFFIKRFCNA